MDYLEFYLLNYFKPGHGAQSRTADHGRAVFSRIVLLTVCYFGIIGGYVSFLRRTLSLPVGSDALQAIVEQNSVRDSLWSSLFSGAVFAIILLLLFLSGILQGRLFPMFDKGQWPTDMAGYAGLYFWSFVAGFAERFVPDVVDRIIRKSESTPKQNNVVGKRKKKYDGETG